MRRHTLRIAQKDRDVFDALRLGTKFVETRAATPRYRGVVEGDELLFTCGTARLLKRVKRVRRFKTIDALLEHYPYRKIFPAAATRGEVYEAYNAYSGYLEKLRTYGIAAWELS